MIIFTQWTKTQPLYRRFTSQFERCSGERIAVITIHIIILFIMKSVWVCGRIIITLRISRIPYYIILIRTLIYWKLFSRILLLLLFYSPELMYWPTYNDNINHVIFVYLTLSFEFWSAAAGRNIDHDVPRSSRVESNIEKNIWELGQQCRINGTG